MLFRIGLVGAVLFAIFAICGFAYIELGATRKAEAPPPVATEQILSAVAGLQPGSLVQPADLGSSAVPLTNVPAGAVLDTAANRSAMVGSMVRAALPQGAPVLDSSLIHPGDHGFLAAVLAPGMRAVTVGVDAITGTAGLIWPGDHVDVVLTQTLTDPSIPVGEQIAAEVVLSDVRVIATDQQLGEGAAVPSGPNAAAAVVRPTATTVTLEVTSEQADKVEVATRLGQLSLVVHSSQLLPTGQDAKMNPPGPVWADEVSPVLANSRFSKNKGPVTAAGPQEAPVDNSVHVYQDANATGIDFKF
jgi:pilus assembly protein CpaB